jgi:hypothetical protein
MMFLAKRYEIQRNARSPLADATIEDVVDLERAIARPFHVETSADAAAIPGDDVVVKFRCDWVGVTTALRARGGLGDRLNAHEATR